MLRLALILAVLAAIVATVLVTGQPAQAQSTDPTVSTVAITSNPGADETYATGDTITVAVTFSEAVTVTTTDGTPRITLDIGGQPRYAGYTGAGGATGQILFSYTVLVSDQDPDGVSVLADSLDLDGGTIQATDDSANASLSHSATTFASHKVDTQVILVSNLNQPESTSTVTISATQSFSYEVTAVIDPSVGLSLQEIILDVKSPSDTLAVTVRAVSLNVDYLVYSYSGSVATAGSQTFTLDSQAEYGLLNHHDTGSVLFFNIVIEGSGTGSVELAATTKNQEDSAGSHGMDSLGHRS